jgi:esterase/lipase superfamily enzyme
MGDVHKNDVLSKFMENGEWDFHHVQATRHNSLFAKHDNENNAAKKSKYICNSISDYILNLGKVPIFSK